MRLCLTHLPVDYNVHYLAIYSHTLSHSLPLSPLPLYLTPSPFSLFLSTLLPHHFVLLLCPSRCILGLLKAEGLVRCTPHREVV